MSLVNPTDFPIVPATTSGTQLADILNRLFNAYQSNQSNATRPPGIKSGGLWSKIDGGTLRLMMFDGTVDIEIGNVTAGVGVFGAQSTLLSAAFRPSSAYKTGDMIYDPTTKGYLIAKADIAANPYNPGDWTPLSDPLKGMKDAILTLVDAKLANYLPLAGGKLTGPLTSTSTIDADGAISSKADLVAFK